jgi:AcrR family transcriptional regulator
VPRVLTSDEVSDFRERLCAVAERLFAEQGPQGVSMRQLAAELGVSPMTPYRYFKDKDDILATVRANGFDRFSDALETAFASSTEPLQRAGAVGDAYFSFALENASAYRLMFDLDQPTEANYPDLVRATERAKLTMTAYVQGLVDGGFLQGDVTLMSHVFWASVHGLVGLHLAGKLAGPIDMPTLRAESFRALSNAYRPHPA